MNPAIWDAKVYDLLMLVDVNFYFIGTTSLRDNASFVIAEWRCLFVFDDMDF